jgi:hypothetical protein
VYDDQYDTFEALADEFGWANAYQRLERMGASRRLLDALYDEHLHREVAKVRDEISSHERDE